MLFRSIYFQYFNAEMSVRIKQWKKYKVKCKAFEELQDKKLKMLTVSSLMVLGKLQMFRNLQEDGSWRSSYVSSGEESTS